MEDDQKKKFKKGRQPKKIKWKTNQSTKFNLIGCDTIVNSPSFLFFFLSSFFLSFFLLSQFTFHLEGVVLKLCMWSKVMGEQETRFAHECEESK